MNEDTCDYGLFADKIIADAAVVIASPPKPSDDTWNDDSTTIWSPDSFNAYVSSDPKDPYNDTSDSSTPSGTSKYPRTVDGSDALSDGGSDDSDEFPFRIRDDDNKTFATPAPPGGFPDTRPQSPG